MRAIDILVVALLCATGGVAAPLLASSADVDAASLVVPLPAIGDTVDYVMEGERKHKATGNEVIASNTTSFRLEVVSVKQTLAADGAAHDALQVNVAAAAENNEVMVRQVFIDLDHRQRIVESRVRDNDTLVESLYGPLGRSPYFDHNDWNQHFAAAADFLAWNAETMVQGETLWPGRNFTQQELDAGLETAIVDGFRAAGTIYDYPQIHHESHAFSSIVGGPMLLDGELAMPLERALYVAGERCDLDLFGQTCRAWAMRYTHTLWFTAESAWPVLVELEARRSGGAHQWSDPWTHAEFTIFAHESAAGHTPIAWRGPYSQVAVQPGPTGVESHPIGSDASSTYSLAAAIRNVRGDPSLAQFQEWLATHTDARLAGFSLSHPVANFWATRGVVPAELRTLAPQWDLAFWSRQAAGSPEEVFVVHTQGQSDAFVNRETGAKELFPTIDRAAMPEQPFALLSTAEALHLQLTGAPGTEPLSMTWGLEPSSASPALSFVSGHQIPWDTVEISSIPNDQQAADPSDQVFVRSTHDALTGLTRSTHQGSTLSATYALQWVEAMQAPPPRIADVPEGAGFTMLESIPLGIAAGGFLGLLWLLFRALSGKFLAWTGYAKLRQDKLLDLPVRRAVYDLVSANPGISARNVSQRTARSLTLALFHLRMLERHAMVKMIRDGRHTRWFLAATTGAAATAILQNDGTRQVHAWLEGAGPSKQGDVANAMHLTHTGVRWHLRRLQEAGLASRERRGRVVEWRITAAASES